MIQEILDLGFEYIELGHGIRMTLVGGILKMVESGKVKVTSLHNFCPLPVEITRASPDCYQFSSGNPPERDRALRHTFQTIDFANPRSPTGNQLYSAFEILGNAPASPTPKRN